MPKLQKCHIINILFLMSQQVVASDDVVYRYEKSLIRKDRIELAAIFSNNYSEIRWDQNGDGKIDYWFIQDGELEIQEYFQENSLKKVTIQKRLSSTRIRLTYVADSSEMLKLVDSRSVPFQMHNNSGNALLDGMDSMDFAKDSPKAVSEETNICKRTIESYFVVKSEWEKIREAAAGFEQQAKIQDMIGENCHKNLSAQQKKQLLSSLQKIYEVDLNGKVENNLFLSCLASYPETQSYVPVYLNKVIKGPLLEPKIKIQCFQGQAPDCGKAAFDEKTCRIDLPIPTPECEKDSALSFTKNIFHETIHAFDGDLKEKNVQNIVDICVRNEASKSNLESLKDLKVADGKKVKVFDIMTNNPASVTHLNAKAAANEVTKVPAEVAAGKLAPGRPEGASSGMASLNSEFKSVASSSSSAPSLKESIRQSEARTYDVRSYANSIVGTAVTQAKAESYSRPSQTRSIASTKTTRSESSVRSSPSSKRNAGSTWLKSDGIANKKSSRVDIPPIERMNLNSRQNTATSGLSNENSSVSEVTAAKEAVTFADESGGTAGRRPAAASNRDLSFNGNSQTSSNPKEQNQSASQKQRAYFIEQLLQKRSKAIWDFVSKNNDQLMNLGIHVLDSENRIWGFQDPENASVRFREQGNRLIREF